MIRTQDGAVISGYTGKLPSSVVIPQALEGCPVTGIHKSAFSRCAEIREVILPQSLRILGAFSFYRCEALELIAMSDGIEDYSDGAVRGCEKLEEIELNMSRNNYRLASRLLTDTDGRLRVRISDAILGRMELTFPSFQNVYHEDTMARAIHPDIQGAGFGYRECVGADGIRLEEYDALFARAVAQDTVTAGRIALGRLMYPVSLRTQYEKAYRDFLEAESGCVLKDIITSVAGTGVSALIEEGLEKISYLAASFPVSGRALDGALALSSGYGLHQVTGILMRGTKTSHRGPLNMLL